LITLGSPDESDGYLTPRGAHLSYNTDAPGNLPGFAGGGVTFPLNTGLGAAAFWNLGVRATTDSIKLEIRDLDGNVATVHLLNVRDTEQVYSLSVDWLRERGIMPDKIYQVIAVVEGYGKQGTIDLNHQPPTPVIGPDPGPGNSLQPAPGLTSRDVSNVGTGRYAISLGQPEESDAALTSRGIRISYNTERGAQAENDPGDCVRDSDGAFHRKSSGFMYRKKTGFFD